MKNVLTQLRQELYDQGDEKTRKAIERFFKEEVRTYGLKSAQVKVLTKKYFKQLDPKNKIIIFELCEELWQSGMFEESIIACDWSYSLRKQFEPADFLVFESWVQGYISNWASCDTFCNRTIGEFLIKFPGFVNEIRRWALSENRWVRRAAAVSLIVPARKGIFLPEIFEIAETLLHDQDDMVQKGYGWLLKSASKPCPNEVFEFVMAHNKTMPRTALRYAIEKLDYSSKNMAMEK